MMLFDEPHPLRQDDVRKAILKFLGDNEVPADTAGRAIRQCLDLLRDVSAVHSLAGQMELSLSGFRSDNDLELYYDLAHQGHDIGFIYKGWDDPGFGIGETVPIPAHDMLLFMAQADTALRMLATNGMGVTTKPTREGGCWLDMTTVIYSDGFNAGTFAAALNTVNECATTLRKLVA